jgi:predicted small lipoprotein YifL
MRYSIRTILCASLLLAMLAACGKKAPSDNSTAGAPSDGVSSVPPAAERATDMSPVDLPLAGAVKEVKAKVLDKEADDKDKGLVRIKVLEITGPVDVSENTRWEVWKPGADPEEQKAEMSAWASNEEAVAPGTWDLRLHYEEGSICKAEGWIRNVVVAAGKLWKAEAVIAAPMQYVRVFATLDGKDAADNARIEVFKAGTDQAEFPALTSFWSTQKQALSAGAYDLRLTYDKDNVKAKAALKGFAVGGDHGVLKKTIALVK